MTESAVEDRGSPVLSPFFARLFGVDLSDTNMVRIFPDRVALLYRQARTGVLVHVIVISVTTYSISLAADGWPTWAWGGVMMALGLLRGAMIEFYHRNPRVFGDALGAAIIFYVVIGFTGIGWGVGAVFVLPSDATPQQVFFILMLGGTAAGTVATLSPFYSAQILALGTSVVPLIIRFAVDGGADEWLMAAALFMFLLAMVATGRNTHNALLNSLRLGVENLDLLDNIRRQSAELEATSRAKTRFLAAASHDLRQPLHALRLQAESLAMRIGGDERSTSIVQRIGHSVSAMERLLNSLLDISRLDAGIIEPRIAPFQMDAVLSALEDEFAARAREAQCDLRFVPCSAYVDTDVTLLETILRNLIANSIRHAPGAKIIVGCRRRANMLAVVVADRGPGIPAELQSRVFEEFFQVGNPERNRDHGLGLGLSIVRRLAGLLELPMTFRSEPGQGTFVALDVPRSEGVRQAPQSMPRSLAGVAGSLVWVIDDDEQGRLALANLIADWGCDVVSGYDAQQLLAEQGEAFLRPDAIVADYRLGQGTGVEAIRQIRQHFGDGALPALIVTGDTAPEQLRDLAATGIYILHKPVAPGRLRALLATLVTSSS